MKLTINLLSTENPVPKELILNKILNKDPVIFLLNDKQTSNINFIPTIGIAEDCQKFTYILDKPSLIKAMSFLYSFTNIDEKNVLIVSPKENAQIVKNFSLEILRLLKHNGVRIS